MLKPRPRSRQSLNRRKKLNNRAKRRRAIAVRLVLAGLKMLRLTASLSHLLKEALMAFQVIAEWVTKSA